jgi:nicotinate-nucleotide pyrophosphorylase (carboxylating)
MESKLDKRKLRAFIRKALEEDVKDGDHTSNACIPADLVSRGKLLVKDQGILAGVKIAKEIFCHLDPDAKIDVLKNDGEKVNPGDIAFVLECNSRAFLKGERLALNTMQRLSGVATMSNKFSEEVQDLPVKILDTRKTTPLLRFLEKWAVRMGGCHNYRDGLYDRIMIKDNHIEAAGGIKRAVNSVQKYLSDSGKDLEMTIEVKNIEEVKEVLALSCGARIMLDNFSVSEIRKAVEFVENQAEVEASGGITLEHVREIALTGVDFISVGALTHSAGSLDLSLKIVS